MSIPIIQDPSRPNKQDGGYYSNWNCARQPMIFTIQRQDVNVISVDDDGSGFIRFTVADNMYSILSTIGGAVYYSELGIAGLVTALTSPFLGTTFIFTDIPYSAVSGGYLNIQLEGYYVAVTVNVYNPVTGRTTVLTDRRTPDSTGLIRLDIAGYCSSFLSKESAFEYDGLVNQRDPYVYGYAVITYFDKWSNGQGDLVTPGNRYYFADAVKYLGEDYGQNLGDYVPNDTDNSPYAMFLTTFVKPTLFIDYPFDLSFIWDELFEGVLLAMNIETFDTTGVSIATYQYPLVQSQQTGINRLLIPQDILTGVDSFDVWIESYGSAPEGYIDTGYLDVGYLDTVIAGSGNIQITEKKRIKVGTVCKDNPICLRWRNDKGGWNNWVFESLQEYNTSAKQEGAINTEPDDIERASKRDKFIQARQSKRIKFGGNYLPEDVQGLTQIEGSPEVQLFWISDNIEFISVKVIPKSFQSNDAQGTIDVECEIELPEYYTVPN